MDVRANTFQMWNSCCWIVGFIVLIARHARRLCLAPEEAPPQRESRGWRGGSDLEARLQGEDELFGLEPRFYRSSASYLNFLFA